MARQMPSKGFDARERHRAGLLLHTLVMLAGLAAAAVANRALSPERLWVHWVALAWGVIYLAHLLAFSRGTLATMSAEGRAQQKS